MSFVRRLENVVFIFGYFFMIYEVVKVLIEMDLDLILFWMVKGILEMIFDVY